MIGYGYEEEKLVALFMADELGDIPAKNILQRGEIATQEEATHLGRFFWAMVNRSAEGNLKCLVKVVPNTGLRSFTTP